MLILRTVTTYYKHEHLYFLWMIDLIIQDRPTEAFSVAKANIHPKSRPRTSGPVSRFAIGDVVWGAVGQLAAFFLRDGIIYLASGIVTYCAIASFRKKSNEAMVSDQHTDFALLFDRRRSTPRSSQRRVSRSPISSSPYFTASELPRKIVIADRIEAGLVQGPCRLPI